MAALPERHKQYYREEAMGEEDWPLLPAIQGQCEGSHTSTVNNKELPLEALQLHSTPWDPL